MAALGCLAPFVRALFGALIGHLIACINGVPWGLGVGFLLGGGVAALTYRLFAQLKKSAD